MKNDEGEHDQAAHDHVTGRPGRFDIIPIFIGLGTRAPIFDGEQNCEVNVREDSREKNDAHQPEQRAEIAQMLRVSIDPLGAKKDLQIAEQMTDDEQDQNHAGDGDDHFSSDRGMVETGNGVHKLSAAQFRD